MSDPLFAKLVTRFRSRALADADLLRAALREGDRAAVEAIAHALSGAAGTFGFPVISEHAAALELAAEAGSDRWADAATQLLSELNTL